MTEYYLLIKNASIYDPLTNTFIKEDLAICKDKIAKRGKNLYVEAQHTIDAKNYFLSPGFIDHHCHIYQGSDNGVNADNYALPLGCTSLCDAGSTGCSNFKDFYFNNINNSICKIYAYLNVGSSGQVSEKCPEKVNPDAIEDSRIKDLCQKYPCIRGLKLRYDNCCVNNNDLAPLIHAQELAKSLGLSLCVHFSNHPRPLADICSILDKGDILCHTYNKQGESIIDEKGNLLPCIKKARENGIIFDSADGFKNFSFNIIRQAINLDFLPDIISTDIINSRAFTSTAYGLTYTMSKYLGLGIDLKEIIKSVTTTPLEAMKIKTDSFMKEGAFADLCLFKLQEVEKFRITDAYGESLDLKQIILPKVTICKGKIAYASLDLWGNNY